MVLAQALGEYGFLAGFFRSLEIAGMQVVDRVRGLEPIHYVFIAVGLVVLWLMFGRVR